MLGTEQRELPCLFRLRQSRGVKGLLERLFCSEEGEPAGRGWQGIRTELMLQGWSRPLPPDWDEAQLEECLFGRRVAGPPGQRRVEPDFASIHEQLQTHKHVTLQLLWEEHIEAHPEGYRYSRFCELYQRWRRKLDVVLRQQHRAGEKVFVDYAGATVPVENRQSDEVRQAQVFVAVLGASSYTYAEASWSQDLANWTGSHVRAFEFFGGVPEIVVPACGPV